MNRSQFKDPVCDLCLTGAVVASSSLTRETTGSNPFNDKYFFSLKISVKTFRKNLELFHQENLMSRLILVFVQFTQRSQDGTLLLSC